jgi:hypothetical protein
VAVRPEDGDTVAAALLQVCRAWDVFLAMVVLGWVGGGGWVGLGLMVVIQWQQQC